MDDNLSLQARDGTALRFGIASWYAWAPGVATADDWPGWLRGEACPDGYATPEVRFLPAPMRRRLDGIGRIALHTAWPCAEGLDDFDFVYGSRHGSLHRTVGLLAALVNDEPLSPAAFSLAVHNNSAGLFSIAKGNHARSTAMAAGEDTLGMTLLEGASMVAEGCERVLVTFAEDRSPEVYEALIPTPYEHPFSVSLLLSADAALQCTLTHEALWRETLEPPEVALMRFLCGETRVVIGVDQPWRLERVGG